MPAFLGFSNLLIPSELECTVTTFLSGGTHSGGRMYHGASNGYVFDAPQLGLCRGHDLCIITY